MVLGTGLPTTNVRYAVKYALKVSQSNHVSLDIEKSSEKIVKVTQIHKKYKNPNTNGNV